MALFEATKGSHKKVIRNSEIMLSSTLSTKIKKLYLSRKMGVEFVNGLST